MYGTLIFSSDPTNILCAGNGSGSKSIFKVEFCAQPMHQIYVMKYCMLYCILE